MKISEVSPASNSKEEEEIRDRTLQGRWDEVAKMCKHNYALIRTVKINESNEDTVLHAAVNSGKERIVAELVNVIVRHEEEQGVVNIPEESEKEEEDKSVVNTIEEREKELEEEDQGVVPQKDEKKSALEIQNARGDNPLHLAASRGFAYMCYCIIGEKNERAYLLRVNNEQGETPLFLAALNGHKDVFLYLRSCDACTVDRLTRKNGDTVLHCAIRREYFDLAVIIIHMDKDLLFDYVNKKQETPLRVLATRPLAFRSCSSLKWWEKLLYKCTRVEQVDVETATKSPPKPTRKTDLSDPNHRVYPENYYETCRHFWPKIAAFFGYFRKKAESPGDTENPERKEKNEDNVDKELGNFPPNYATISERLRFAYVLAARFSGSDLFGIRRMKEKHVWSAQLLDLLMKEPTDAYFGSGTQPVRRDQSIQEIFAAAPPCPKSNDQGRGDVKDEIDKDLVAIINAIIGQGDVKDKINKDSTLLVAIRNAIIGQGDVKDEIDRDSTLLVAARNGILEMVDKILHDIPSVIEETTFEYKRNIVLAAVESRQPNVIEALRKHELWDTLIEGVDKDENTALHLAAQQSKHSRAWRIPGSAMQMLWDIKWYEYVRGLEPHHFHLRNNQDSKTPPEVFTESHEKLVKDGGDWLKDTSESCSVVAALIAGVAFATSNAVPGGNNEETGKPNFEGQPAFDVFAITSLVALCFSVTALIMFLAILTSRKTARDFRRDLPIKLLLGLSSLFVSIASMLVSFCAAHFFVVRDKFKGILFPIYAATCLPVSFYAIAQFPLYVDILRAIFTGVPQPSDKGRDW